MKFLITSMIMFLTFLIININILTINGLKNSMKFTSQFDNLKNKYKEKILDGEINHNKLMNDTTIISVLEKKIKSIYNKLNLNTDELIHLKKVTTNVDEYIVFLKILIDKLNSFAKLENSIQITNNTKLLINNKKKFDNYQFESINSKVKNIEYEKNKSLISGNKKNNSAFQYHIKQNYTLSHKASRNKHFEKKPSYVNISHIKEQSSNIHFYQLKLFILFMLERLVNLNLNLK